LKIRNEGIRFASDFKNHATNHRISLPNLLT
jgi:hypothetical protein